MVTFFCFPGWWVDQSESTDSHLATVVELNRKLFLPLVEDDADHGTVITRH